MTAKFITSKDILKDNKKLTFFYNYNKYLYTPYNFVYKEDADCFNQHNVQKWINEITNQLIKLKGDGFIHYQLQNGVKIVINYQRTHYNQILLDRVVNNEVVSARAYDFIFFWMANICQQYKINLLDCFILLVYKIGFDYDYVDKNYQEHNNIYVQIKKSINFNIVYNIDTCSNSYYNNFFNTLWKEIGKRQRSQIIYINNLFTKSKTVDTFYAFTKTLNKDNNKIEVLKSINNSLLLLSLLLMDYTSSITITIDGETHNIFNIKTKEIVKFFSILNNTKLDSNKLYNILYCIYKYSHDYFNDEVARFLILLFTNNSIVTDNMQSLAIKQFYNLLYKIDNTNENKPDVSTKTIKENVVYYIKRDEFNINNKRIYKCLYKINNIDNNNVNIVIMKQIDGNRTGSKYVLNKYDCKKLNIKYEPDLEVFSSELEWITEKSK